VIQGEYDQKQIGGAAKVNFKVVIFGAGVLLLGAVFLFLWRRRRQPIK
jgi:MYXO-CTERM domain-containing protein